MLRAYRTEAGVTAACGPARTRGGGDSVTPRLPLLRECAWSSGQPVCLEGKGNQAVASNLWAESF